MKLIKYIICLFAFLGVAVLNGDCFQEYLCQFSGQLYSVQLFLTEEQQSGQVFADLSDMAHRHDVFLYVADKRQTSSLNMTLDIYSSSPDAERGLRRRFKIEEKDYKSIFFTSTRVSFHSLADFADAGSITLLRCAGEVRNQADFAGELNEKYKCGEDYLGESDPGWKNSDEAKLLAAAWLIPTVLALIMSCYEVLLKRKETCVRRSLGERPAVIFLKNAGLDAAVFAFLFAVSFGVLSFFTQTLFLWRLSLVMFAVLLAVNSAAFAGLFVFDLKKAFTHVGESLSLLSASYLLKLITAILTVLIIAGNAAQVTELISYKKREVFFEKYSGFSYKEFVFAPRQENTGIDYMSLSATMKYKLYQKLFTSGDAVLQSTAIDLGNIAHKKYEMVVFNRNAKENLLEYFRDLSDADISEEKMYLLVPRKGLKEADFEKLEQSAIDSAKNDINGCFFYYNCEIEVIPYDGNRDVFVLDNNQNPGRGCYIRNPVVAFSNLREDVLPFRGEQAIYPSAYFKGMMFRISDGELSDFVSEYGFSLRSDYYSDDNVGETFAHYRAGLLRSTAINCAASVLMLLLELMVIWMVIKIEYSVNAMELAVKTVLGCGLWSKNKKILLITLIVMAVGSAAAVFAAKLLGLADAGVVISGCALLSLLETATVIRFIKKMESARIPKILKGGSL